MSSIDLAAARARCDAATPGPWLADHRDESAFDVLDDERIALGGDRGSAVTSPLHPDTFVSGSGWPHYDATANAELIAHARTDLPAALDIIDAVLALHPVEPWDYIDPRTEKDYGQIIGCPNCESTGPCATRLAIEPTIVYGGAQNVWWRSDCPTCVSQGSADAFAPDHDASPMCESGKRPHCTCARCWG